MTTHEFNADTQFNFSQPVFEPTRTPVKGLPHPWEPTDADNDEETQ